MFKHIRDIYSKVGFSMIFRYLYWTYIYPIWDRYNIFAFKDFKGVRVFYTYNCWYTDFALV